jgi:hypothetical protein
MQVFQDRHGELQAQEEHELDDFVDAYDGPENLLDSTRLVAEFLQLGDC